MGHKTGIEEYVILKDGKRLRCGYTTGTCAAAAAKAAAKMLLGGETVEETAVETPKGILLHLLVEEIRTGEGWVSCGVRKDGGDDPDATHGLLICAKVSFGAGGNTDGTGARISLDGGAGVGRVTRPGLSQAVGEAAINPVPRSMIFENVREICEMYGCEKELQVEIFVPGGEAVGAKTFNPRLGILGGISILGTSGIVVPMSEAALLASIRLEMEMLVAAGARYLVITPGNYGEVFSREQMDVDLTYSMKCSNYLGETLDMAVELGVRGILFISHIGKFIKVSGGIMDTHSKNADSRAELLAAQALRAGADRKTALRILNTLTTEEGVQVLKEAGILTETMKVMAEKVQFYLDHRTKQNIQTAAVIFSNVEGVLAQTEQVPCLLQAIEEQKKGTNK